MMRLRGDRSAQNDSLEFEGKAQLHLTQTVGGLSDSGAIEPQGKGGRRGEGVNGVKVALGCL
ncbi:hypothetical protein Csa_007528 [Cucumis sativus]|uniref:Uncharacterized protein n=1 Tax=Cucumis sativus TaxID=3659 RepID=A0A0A0LYJ2_CUCSA|nr:hypothetical protein Csa_007528 [Cucumis sativus]